MLSKIAVQNCSLKQLKRLLGRVLGLPDRDGDSNPELIRGPH